MTEEDESPGAKLRRLHGEYLATWDAWTRYIADVSEFGPIDDESRKLFAEVSRRAEMFNDELDRVTDDMVERVGEIAHKLTGDKPPNYPPGVDPERMRELWRTNLRDAIRDTVTQREDGSDEQ